MSLLNTKSLKSHLFLFLIFSLFTCTAKGLGTDPFKISLNKDTIVQYCNQAVLIAKDVNISGIASISGMKVSFTKGYVAGEDLLTYNGTKLQSSTSSDGTLELKGSTLIQDYMDAIQTVTYKNNKAVPTIGVRQITISLIDVDYLPATSHFYRFVTKPGCTWTAARDEAASDAMMYFGLRGYLATVTSKVENDFIKLKTKGVGWIGASDAAVEGDWRWVTGPEGLEDSLLGKPQGRLFWKGTGSQYASGVSGTGPVKGQYTNWNTGTPEPNNAGNENYAHITKFPEPEQAANSYKWNDLPNFPTSDPTSDYYPSGYLIEFGGMKDDPVVHLSATLDLKINTILFKPQTIASICAGDSVKLNPNVSPLYASYRWSPSISAAKDTLESPYTSPVDTTKYTVYGTRGICKDSAYFTVPVIPIPLVSFSIDSTTCVGYNLDVSYTGDANSAISRFIWIFGGDTVVNALDSARIIIPLGMNKLQRNLKLIVTQNGCSNSDSLRNIHVIPKLSQWTVNSPLLCLPDSFEFMVTNPNPLEQYNWNFGDEKRGAGSDVFHIYQLSGKYDIQLKVTNADNCSNTATVTDMVFAAPLPVAVFTLDHTTVYKNAPKVVFTNTSSGATSYLWNFGDDTTSDLESPSHDYTSTGNKKVLLEASSEFACKDTVSHTLLVAFDHIFPPNGFSPNAPDPVDRVFKLDSEGVVPAGYHLIVLSRWEDLVFEAKNEIKGWDGRIKDGSFAPAGVYVWVLDYTDSLGRKHQQTGTVTLVY